MVVQWSQSSHSDHTAAAAVSSNTHISPVTYHFLLQHPPAFTTLIKMLFPVLMACSGLLLVLHSQESEASPLGVCIRNCAQCKKMFGDYFEGQLCADWCVKYKGKVVPDCEDVDTIAQFLNKLE